MYRTLNFGEIWTLLIVGVASVAKCWRQNPQISHLGSLVNIPNMQIHEGTWLVDQHCGNDCSINRAPPIVVAIRNSFGGELALSEYFPSSYYNELGGTLLQAPVVLRWMSVSGGCSPWSLAGRRVRHLVNISHQSGRRAAASVDVWRRRCRETRAGCLRAAPPSSL